MKNPYKIRSTQLSTVILTAALLLAACNITTPTPAAATLPPSMPTPTPTSPPADTPTPAATEPPTPAPTIADTAAPPTPVTPAIFHMQDANSGWMVSDKGRVLRTTTGMGGWQDITPSQAPAPQPDVPIALPTAFFLDANHAWLAYLAQSQQQGALLLRTTDGGSTWLADGTLPPGEDFGGSYGPVSFDFIDAQTGWLWTQIHPGMMHVYPALYQTTDGGKNWQIVYDPMPEAADPNISLRGSYSLSFGSRLFTFVDAKNGFAGTGVLQSTKDGGKTWSNVDLPKPAGLPPFTNEYPYAAPPIFANPQDGAVPVYLYEFDKVNLPPGDSFSDLPKASYLAWTHDGGNTWKALPMPALLGTFTMLDAKTAWFLGKSDPSMGVPPTLFSTIDGGLTWTSVGGNMPLPLGSQLQYIDPATGFAIAPEYSEHALFAPFDANLSDQGYLYLAPGWNPVNLTVK